MLLSTQTSIIAQRFGVEGALRCIAKAGFDCFDMTFLELREDDEQRVYSDEYMEFAQELKKLMNELHISCNQAHAHIPSETEDEEYNKDSYWRICREMEFAAILGAKVIIIHANHVSDYKEEEFDYNVKFYNQFIPCCKQFGIKVAVENGYLIDEHQKYVKHIVPTYLSFSEDMAEFYDRLDSRYFTVCLDLGHSTLLGEEPQKAIRVLGSERLHALHIQDNDYYRDGHLIPYLGNICWDEVCKALADINYDGEFTFETHHFLDNFPNDFYDEAVGFMGKVGRYLVRKVETYKKNNGSRI